MLVLYNVIYYVFRDASDLQHVTVDCTNYIWSISKLMCTYHVMVDCANYIIWESLSEPTLTGHLVQ